MITKLNPYKFISENYNWLLKWIENAKPTGNPDGMQIFKNGLSSKIIYEELNKKEIKKIFDENFDMVRIRKEHIDNILFACIFSIGNTTHAPSGSGITFMEGFLNKYGRLPTKDDKVTINYLEGNGIKRWRTEYYGLVPLSNGNEFQWVDGIKPDSYRPIYIILSEFKITHKKNERK